MGKLIELTMNLLLFLALFFATLIVLGAFFAQTILVAIVALIIARLLKTKMSYSIHSDSNYKKDTLT